MEMHIDDFVYILKLKLSTAIPSIIIIIIIFVDTRLNSSTSPKHTQKKQCVEHGEDIRKIWTREPQTKRRNNISFSSSFAQILGPNFLVLNVQPQKINLRVANYNHIWTHHTRASYTPPTPITRIRSSVPHSRRHSPAHSMLHIDVVVVAVISVATVNHNLDKLIQFPQSKYVFIYGVFSFY